MPSLPDCSSRRPEFRLSAPRALGNATVCTFSDCDRQNRYPRNNDIVSRPRCHRIDTAATHKRVSQSRTAVDKSEHEETCRRRPTSFKNASGPTHVCISARSAIGTVTEPRATADVAVSDASCGEPGRQSSGAGQPRPPIRLTHFRSVINRHQAPVRTNRRRPCTRRRRQTRAASC
jgi:hypothetical protein